MVLIQKLVKLNSGYVYRLLSNFYRVPIFCGYVAISLVTLRLYYRWTFGKCKCETTMVGKTVIITGGNTGIGKSTAQELAKRGARIILACRNQERGQEAANAITAATGNPHILYKPLDLCSFASIRRFVDDFLETEKRLDVLINNAGVMGTEHRQTTVDKCERILQSNHLGHFLLTNLLLGVTANCVHPGAVRTEFSKELTGILLRMMKYALWLAGKTPMQGAQTTLHLALSRELENVSGNYYADCKEQRIKQCALDETAAAKLWTMSEEIISASESRQK